MNLHVATHIRRLSAAALLLVAFSAFSQTSTSPQPAAAQSFAFDVVSIKLFKSDTPSRSITDSRDIFSTNVPVASLMQYIFNMPMPGQISGFPDWAGSEQYQIDAKIDDETLAALHKLPDSEADRQHRDMLIAILTDRFGLKYHHETKDLPVYELTVAKGGAKLTKADTKSISVMSNRGSIKASGIELSDLSKRLSKTLGRPIIDKTNMPGRFDLQLTWSPDEDPSNGDNGPSIFTALQEQLGLKLVSAKAPVDTIVVDSLTRPTVD